MSSIASRTSPGSFIKLQSGVQHSFESSMMIQFPDPVQILVIIFVKSPEFYFVILPHQTVSLHGLLFVVHISSLTFEYLSFPFQHEESQLFQIPQAILKTSKDKLVELGVLQNLVFVFFLKCVLL